LCHNCGACLHSCQYAPPHEFAVNVPKALATVRVQTYSDYAWPPALGALYKRAGLTLSLAGAFGLALFLVLVLMVNGSLFHEPLAGNFYAIFPHNTLALMFGAVFLYAVVALGIGVTRFWRRVSPAAPVEGAKAEVAVEATRNALTLKYLDGGHGDGCNNEDDRFSLWRRRFHHLTFYGFLLCFAATSVATLYHYLLDYQAPYPVFSLPVQLGIFGGIGLLVGPAGLLWLNIRRHPLHGDVAQRPMDRGFIALLFLTSLSGLALLAWRDTGAMALLLAVHLGIVMAFFLTMPYGKFAHGIFRCAALLKSSIEKRQPNRLGLGD
jgi:citrate/tricarballylate utilization protein